MHEVTQKIEALLFLAGEAVSYSELARVLAVSVGAIETCCTELAEALREHGLALLRTPDHVQLVTSAAVAGFVREFLQGEARELSAAAAETLAIVAYRGPISRFDITAIRGVDSRRILQQLVLRGLIRKKSAPASRIVHYVIAEEFLQHLGITEVTALPDFAQLSSDERVKKFLEETATHDGA